LKSLCYDARSEKHQNIRQLMFVVEYRRSGTVSCPHFQGQSRARRIPASRLYFDVRAMVWAVIGARETKEPTRWAEILHNTVCTRIYCSLL